MDTAYNLLSTVTIPIQTNINGVSEVVNQMVTNDIDGTGVYIPTDATISPPTSDISNGCVISDDWGFMKVCKDTTKTDDVKYNTCQDCSKSICKKIGVPSHLLVGFVDEID